VLLSAFPLFSSSEFGYIMARTKSPAMRREPSDLHKQSNGVIHRDGYSEKSIPSMLEDNLVANASSKAPMSSMGAPTSQAGLASLLFSVGGIYMSLSVVIPNHNRRCSIC